LNFLSQVQYLQNWLHSDQPVVLQETVCGVVVDIDLVIKGLTNAGLLLAGKICLKEQGYFEQ
jgi:hypothetical protein